MSSGVRSGEAGVCRAGTWDSWSGAGAALGFAHAHFLLHVAPKGGHFNSGSIIAIDATVPVPPLATPSRHSTLLSAPPFPRHHLLQLHYCPHHSTSQPNEAPAAAAAASKPCHWRAALTAPPAAALISPPLGIPTPTTLLPSVVRKQ